MMPEEVGAEYARQLGDMKMYSKPLINVLTMMAEDYINHAPVVVKTIEKHFNSVGPSIKSFVLSLIDSIVKNVRKDYPILFSQNIVSFFCAVFETIKGKSADDKAKQQMFKVRQSWNTIFPQRKLYAIDVRCHNMDKNWPISDPPRNNNVTSNVHGNEQELKPPLTDDVRTTIIDESTNIGGQILTPELPGPIFWNKSQNPWEKILPVVLKNSSQYRPDLVLVVRDNDKEEEIPINSTWLAIRSEGFAKAVDELRLTNTLAQQDRLFLPDTSAHVLKHVLNYIYNNNFKKGVTDVDLLNLLDFNQHYFTAGLSKKCESLLQKRLKVQNALKVMKKATLYNLEDLKTATLAFVFKNIKAVFRCPEFLTLTLSEVTELVGKDELNCAEVDIFNAALSWGKNFYAKTVVGGGDSRPPLPTELRAVLKDIVMNIRFPLMTAEDFNAFVGSSKLLTNEERLEVYEYIAAADGSKPVVRFNANPRVFRPVKGRHGSDDLMIPLQANYDDQSTSNSAKDNSTFSLRHATDKFFAQGQTRVMKKSTSQQLGENSTIFTSNRKRAKALSSFDKCENKEKSYMKKGCTFKSLDEFITHLAVHPKIFRNRTTEVNLSGVTLEECYKYTTATLPNMYELKLDLNLPINGDITRFERYFDIRKFLFHRREDCDENDVKLELLWDTKMNIEIIINGVTMLRMNPLEKELTIGFRNDSTAILAGLRKSEQLHKLSLMKTDVPRFDFFPCKYLKQVLFYHLYSLSESDLGDFTRKCSSLVSLSSWIVCPWWENRRMSKNANNKTGVSLYSPSELDLVRDLVSGPKLKHMALCKVVLMLPSIKPAVKVGLTELYLDKCFWPDQFGYNFHILFPNLRRCAIRQRKTETARQNFPSTVNIKLLYNIIELKYIEWIRIWGMDWNERFSPVPSPTKSLRSSVAPVSGIEEATVKSFMQSCQIPEDADNFLLDKDTTTNVWKGKVFNEDEPQEYDNGFHDLMDQFDYEFFKIKTFFRDHQTSQNDFNINLELP